MFEHVKEWFKNCKNSLKSVRPRLDVAPIEVHKELMDFLNKNPLWINEQNVVMHILFGQELSICRNCGKEMSFNDRGKKYCSIKCAQNSKEVKEKIANTNLKKYGVKIPIMSEQVQNGIKTRNKEKYGVEWTVQLKEVQDKRQITNIERYGGNSPACSELIKDKMKNTCLQKYGVEHATSNSDVIEKIKLTKLEKYGTAFVCDHKKITKKLLIRGYFIHKKRWLENDIEPLFDENEWEGGYHNINGKKYKWKCKKCGSIFEQPSLMNSHIDGIPRPIPRCLKCYPFTHGYSGMEKELVEFCRHYFTNLIENDKTLIAPYELDIVIPDKKIAIEFNGSYWHSAQAGKDKNYHLNKTELCESKGYRLIHIFEWEWITKQEIIKEKLKAILGVEQEKVYARKCIVKEISVKEKNEFLNKYHIQGEDKSKIKLGLFYNNELVAVMTFGSSRFNKNYDWELIRYASRAGYQILGGAGKLLAYFRKHYPGLIITYADRRFSQGNMYKKLGFKLEKISKPSYFWVKNDLILSRFQTQKHKLIKLLGQNFDKNNSEVKNLINNNFYQIFDCGTLVYSL